jgi:hypothetical protein
MASFRRKDRFSKEKHPPSGWGCGGLLGFTALPGGGTMCLDVGLGEVHMSPPRESQGSTRIARQTALDRISQRTRNSAIPRRASKNSREFDAQLFLATIGEGRKAMLLPKKHTIFTQGDPADAVRVSKAFFKFIVFRPTDIMRRPGNC